MSREDSVNIDDAIDFEDSGDAYENDNHGDSFIFFKTRAGAANELGVVQGIGLNIPLTDWARAGSGAAMLWRAFL